MALETQRGEAHGTTHQLVNAAAARVVITFPVKAHARGQVIDELHLVDAVLRLARRRPRRLLLALEFDKELTIEPRPRGGVRRGGRLAGLRIAEEVLADAAVNGRLDNRLSLVAAVLGDLARR